MFHCLQPPAHTESQRRPVHGERKMGSGAHKTVIQGLSGFP